MLRHHPRSRWAVLLLTVGLLSVTEVRAAPQIPIGPPETPKVVASSELAGKGSAVLTGNWTLQGDLVLAGDTHLTFKSAHVNLEGNLFLGGNTLLSIEENSVFNVAQKQSFQYGIEAKDQSSLVVTDSEVQTNGGTADVLLPTSFIAKDDASLVVRNAHLDMKRNWFLGGFKDRAKLVSVNTKDLPNEIYPEDASTVQIEGKDTKALVWIKFIKDQFAILDDMPNVSKPYRWNFGRNRPNKTNVKYELDVKDAAVGINIKSLPGSDIKIVDNQWPIGIGYSVEGVNEPETVSGLDGGTERRNLQITKGRKLIIVNSLIAGWQFGASHSTQPVALKDSTVNESIAGDQGILHATNCRFLYGGLGAFGKGAQYDVEASDIRSFSILANNDGVVRIQNSTIHGSTIQASDDGRIVLLNNDITTNANPYFGGKNAAVHFVTEGKGVIIGAGISPLKTAQKGQTVTFTGDAFVETRVKNLTGNYDLSYKRVSDGQFVPIQRGVPSNVHGGLLGTLNTDTLVAGEYEVTLQLSLSDGTRVQVKRPFSITAASASRLE